jgi:hypothetical protein
MEALCKIGKVCKINVPSHPSVALDAELCKIYRCKVGVHEATRQRARWKRGAVSASEHFIVDPETGEERKAMLLEVTTRRAPMGPIDKTGYVTLDGHSVVKIGDKLLLTGQKLF